MDPRCAKCKGKMVRCGKKQLFYKVKQLFIKGRDWIGESAEKIKFDGEPMEWN